jgi:hypothetical protein
MNPITEQEAGGPLIGPFPVSRAPICIGLDYWRKPIPTNQFDWCAWDDNTAPDGPQAFGSTREEAVANLFTELEIDEDDGGELYCSHCGEPLSVKYHWATMTEPHGETHTDEWEQCTSCGACDDVGKLGVIEYYPAVVTIPCPGCGAKEHAHCTCEDGGEDE